MLCIYDYETRPYIPYRLHWYNGDEEPLLNLEESLTTRGFYKVTCESAKDFAFRGAIPGFSCCHEIEDDIQHWSGFRNFNTLTFTYGYGDDEEDDIDGKTATSIVKEMGDSLKIYLPTRGSIRRLLEDKDPNLALNYRRT
jgi:hypothetical protein